MAAGEVINAEGEGYIRSTQRLSAMASWWHLGLEQPSGSRVSLGHSLRGAGRLRVSQKRAILSTYAAQCSARQVSGIKLVSKAGQGEAGPNAKTYARGRICCEPRLWNPSSSPCLSQSSSRPWTRPWTQTRSRTRSRTRASRRGRSHSSARHTNLLVVSSRTTRRLFSA